MSVEIGASVGSEVSVGEGISIGVGGIGVLVGARVGGMRVKVAVGSRIGVKVGGAVAVGGVAAISTGFVVGCAAIAVCVAWTAANCATRVPLLADSPDSKLCKLAF